MKLKLLKKANESAEHRYVLHLNFAPIQQAQIAKYAIFKWPETKQLYCTSMLIFSLIE